MVPILYTSARNYTSFSATKFTKQIALANPLRQNSALPGVLGNAITSLMLDMPVTNKTKRSKPSPKPACGHVPNLLVLTCPN